ncbi:hypothetical protein GFV12_03185 [Desulfurobacterium thermolithotrophum]|uniref:hypothetical protein n=1 Tax=Desulfurobacterium thermolithotrophum TaxID=64160 RepID=UPI0013D85DD9|nr:hypothetical protein [Desulfurobacterium thermolithotrophum]
MEIKVYRQGESIPVLVFMANSLKDLQLAIRFIEEEDKKTGVTAVYEAPSAKDLAKREISSITDFYINQKLGEIDEDLADITSEAQVIEGRILYIAAKEKVTITTDEVKQKIALFVAGAYTQEQAIEDLKAKGLSDESVQKILPLLARAVEIAKILNWKEEIWDKEGELESQIDSMTLEELLQLDVKKLCEDTYSGIPLEV